MSFFREQYNYKFYPDDDKNLLLSPDKYLPVNDYNISKFTNIEPWFQPEKKYNNIMLNTNNITNNKRYRDYMTKYSKEIIEFNENLYKKQIIRS